MLLFQAFAVFFAIFMIYVIRIHYQKKHFDHFEFGMWLAIWVGFIFLSLFPQTIRGVAETFRIGRVFDAIVILAFMVLTTVTILNRFAIKRLEKKLEEKVRAAALDVKKK